MRIKHSIIKSFASFDRSKQKYREIPKIKKEEKIWIIKKGDIFIPLKPDELDKKGKPKKKFRMNKELQKKFVINDLLNEYFLKK